MGIAYECLQMFTKKSLEIEGGCLRSALVCLDNLSPVGGGCFPSPTKLVKAG